MHNDLKHAVSGSKHRTNNHYFHSEKVFHVRLKWNSPEIWRICNCNCNPGNVSLFLNLTSWLFLDRPSKSFMFNAKDWHELWTQRLYLCRSPWCWKIQTVEKFKVMLYDALMNKVSISWLLTSCVFCICTQINKTNIFTTMADLTIRPWKHKWPVTYRDTQDSAFPEILIPRLRLCTQFHQTHLANSWLSVPNI